MKTFIFSLAVFISTVFYGQESDKNASIIHVYPIEVDSIVYVESTAEILQIQLFDSKNKLKKSFIYGFKRGYIDMRSYDRGVYFVEVTTSEGVFSEKIYNAMAKHKP